MAGEASRRACVLVPLFPLAARLRSEPELTREALAIFAGNGNAARVVAATRPARRAGLKPGFTLSQARALLPKLAARPRDADCERSAQEALIEAAESVSPRVEDSGEGVAYVDLEGLARHFPGTSFEAQAGQALVEAIEKVGLPARVGIAASKLAARVAAESPGSPTIVPAGEEAHFLAPLPLARLSPVTQIATTLGRWGIRSIGELANLPAAEVVSRLGHLGQELHATARGIDLRPLTPYQPPPSFREGMALEWPLVSLEPFLFVGRAALERLTRRLESQGLACKRLGLSLQLEPDGLYERDIELPAPTRDIKTLLTLLRLELEARPPGAPVTGFRLLAHPDRPREAQLTLFGPESLSPDRLATTLARLFALLGPERCGSPRPTDGHRPEHFRLEPYAPPPPPKERREPPRGRGLLAVRVLRPPVPLEVLTTHPLPSTVAEQAPAYASVDGALPPPPELTRLRILSVGPRPTHGPEPASELSVVPIPERSARQGTRHQRATTPTIRGRVQVAAGPWGLEEEWWSSDRIERDYWDIELSDGGIYRIYRQRADGEWYADGVYD